MQKISTNHLGKSTQRCAPTMKAIEMDKINVQHKNQQGGLTSAQSRCTQKSLVDNLPVFVKSDDVVSKIPTTITSSVNSDKLLHAVVIISKGSSHLAVPGRDTGNSFSSTGADSPRRRSSPNIEENVSLVQQSAFVSFCRETTAGYDAGHISLNTPTSVLVSCKSQCDKSTIVAKLPARPFVRSCPDTMSGDGVAIHDNIRPGCSSTASAILDKMTARDKPEDVKDDGFALEVGDDEAFDDTVSHISSSLACSLYLSTTSTQRSSLRDRGAKLVRSLKKRFSLPGGDRSSRNARMRAERPPAAVSAVRSRSECEEKKKTNRKMANEAVKAILVGPETDEIVTQNRGRAVFGAGNNGKTRRADPKDVGYKLQDHVNVNDNGVSVSVVDAGAGSDVVNYYNGRLESVTKASRRVAQDTSDNSSLLCTTFFDNHSAVPVSWWCSQDCTSEICHHSECEKLNHQRPFMLCRDCDESVHGSGNSVGHLRFDLFKRGILSASTSELSLGSKCSQSEPDVLDPFATTDHTEPGNKMLVEKNENDDEEEETEDIFSVSQRLRRKKVIKIKRSKIETCSNSPSSASYGKLPPRRCNSLYGDDFSSPNAFADHAEGEDSQHYPRLIRTNSMRHETKAAYSSNRFKKLYQNLVDSAGHQQDLDEDDSQRSIDIPSGPEPARISSSVGRATTSIAADAGAPESPSLTESDDSLDDTLNMPKNYKRVAFVRQNSRSVKNGDAARALRDQHRSLTNAHSVDSDVVVAGVAHLYKRKGMRINFGKNRSEHSRQESANSTPSVESFDLVFDTSSGSVDGETVQVHKGLVLKDAISGPLDRRGLSINQVDVFLWASRTALPLQSDCFLLVGSTLTVRVKEDEKRNLSLQSSSSVRSSSPATTSTSAAQSSSSSPAHSKDKKVQPNGMYLKRSEHPSTHGMCQTPTTSSSVSTAATTLPQTSSSIASNILNNNNVVLDSPVKQHIRSAFRPKNIPLNKTETHPMAYAIVSDEDPSSVHGQTSQQHLSSVFYVESIKSKKSVSSEEGSCADVSPYSTLTRQDVKTTIPPPTTKPPSKLQSLFNNPFLKTQDKHEQLNELLNLYSTIGLPKMPDLLTLGRPHYDPSIFHLERHWTEIVANHESLNKRQRDQQEAIWEMLTTEVEYIRKLRVVIDLFMCCLFNLQNEQILNEIEADKLFSNICDVYYATCHFWSSHISQVLQQARETRELLNPCLLKAGFLVFDKIFEPYTKYCLEQDICREYIKTKTKENELFKIFIMWAETQSQCNRLKLVDLIVKPWQRLTKYKLLLYAMRKPLDKMEPSASIVEQKDDISSMWAQALGPSQLLRLQDMMSGPWQRLMRYRLLLKEILKRTEKIEGPASVEQCKSICIMIEQVEKFVFQVNIAMRQRHECKQLSLMIDRIESYDAVDAPNEECVKLINEFCKLDLNCPVPGCSQQEMRILLLEGALKLKDTYSKMDVYCFLFTDMLLITKPAAKRGDKVKVIKPPMRLDKIVLHSLRDITSFMLLYLNEYHMAQAVYTFHGDSKLWMDNVSKAQMDYKGKRHQYLTRNDALIMDLYEDIDDDYPLFVDGSTIDLGGGGGGVGGGGRGGGVEVGRTDSCSSADTFLPNIGGHDQPAAVTVTAGGSSRGVGGDESSSGVILPTSPRPRSANQSTARYQGPPKVAVKSQLSAPSDLGPTLSNYTDSGSSTTATVGKKTDNLLAIPKLKCYRSEVMAAVGGFDYKDQSVGEDVGNKLDSDAATKNRLNQRRGLNRNERRYHTADTICELDDKNESSGTGGGVHKRMSWNYGTSISMHVDGGTREETLSASKVLAGQEEQGSREARLSLSDSMRSIQSSSGVSSTVSLHHASPPEEGVAGDLQELELYGVDILTTDFTSDDSKKNGKRKNGHCSVKMTDVETQTPIVFYEGAFYLAQPDCKEPHAGGLVPLSPLSGDCFVSAIRLPPTRTRPQSSSLPDFTDILVPTNGGSNGQRFVAAYRDISCTPAADFLRQSGTIQVPTDRSELMRNIVTEHSLAHATQPVEGVMTEGVITTPSGESAVQRRRLSATQRHRLMNKEMLLASATLEASEV